MAVIRPILKQKAQNRVSVFLHDYLAVGTTIPVDELLKENLVN